MNITSCQPLRTRKLIGAKYSTRLDAKSGQRQIRIDEKSSKLTTFTPPMGDWRSHGYILVLLPHTKSSFQKKEHEAVESFEGVGVQILISDILLNVTDFDSLNDLGHYSKRCGQKNLPVKT